MKRIITLMGVLGVVTYFSACAEDNSVLAPVSTENNAAVVTSSSSQSKSTPKSESSKTVVNDTLDRDSSVVKKDTIHNKVVIDKSTGNAVTPYMSSGETFCWTEGCAPASSTSAPESSASDDSGITIDQPSQDPPTVNGDQMTDNRDGQTYKLQTVGGKLWMAQDLNYKAASSKCFDDKDENCSKYGSLYTYSIASKACPAGWRLPTRDEAQAVISDESYPWSYSGRCKTGECGFTGEMGFHWTTATPQDGDKNFDSNKGDGYVVIIVEKEPNYAGDNEQKFFQVDDKMKYFSVRCVQE